MTNREISPKVLEIDLGSMKGTIKVVHKDIQKTFIGGFGIGVKLAYDRIEPGLDPYDPQNPIIISAGALGGTLVPASSRISAITKYPLTRAVAMGNGGMSLSQKLRGAGFDHLVITGKAPKPARGCWLQGHRGEARWRKDKGGARFCAKAALARVPNLFFQTVTRSLVFK